MTSVPWPSWDAVAPLTALAAIVVRPLVRAAERRAGHGRARAGARDARPTPGPRHRRDGVAGHVATLARPVCSCCGCDRRMLCRRCRRGGLCPRCNP